MDSLIYCLADSNNYKYKKAVKIFYTGENDYPNFNECDFAVSFHDIDVAGRNLRYPLYALDPSTAVTSPPTPEKRSFCSFVMSHFTKCDPRRIKIADAIEEYKPIAYGGEFRNNTGGKVSDKAEFISRYKFNLALENSLLDGYVTEKISDSFAAKTVPIYWGGKLALTDFNPESFINVEDFSTLDSLVRHIREIDEDDSRYLSMLNSPSRMADTIEDFDERLGVFLNHIADTRGKFRTDYGEMGDLARRCSAVLPLSHRNSFLKLSKIIGNLLPSSH